MPKNKLCILDDDHTWVELFYKWIKKINANVEITSYIKHIDFLDNISDVINYDYIIIDYYLDGTTACTIIPLIREINPNVLIICSSSYFDNGNNFKLMKHILNKGATRVCPKNSEVFEMIFESHSKIHKF